MAIVMKKQTVWRFAVSSLLIAVMTVPNFGYRAFAAPTYVSPSYGVDEVFFGSGGVNDANSANYNARASLGDTGVGNSASANFQAYGGFTTTEEPFLEFVVNAQSVDLGVQSTGIATTGTATFTIRAWLADGYSITTTSDGPINDTYAITTLNTPTASSPGTEQFGINLRANTSPATVGANPVQLPDASFSYGQVGADYNTPNQYKYVKGDEIAFSNQSSSITQYTITYMMNVRGSTPAGTYIMNHNMVATARY